MSWMERLQQQTPRQDTPDPPGGGITTTDSPESVTCQIIGNVCRIVYAPDQYQKHRHRDGETLDIDGRRLTLRIEEAAL